MERTDNDCILLPRKAVAKFIKDYVVANYAMQMFTYLAAKKRLEIHLDTDEICKLLDIKRGELEACRRRGDIKSFHFGGVRFYSAFDIARVAELIHRPRRFRKLVNMPTATLPEETWA